ncbi:hypothetical protein B0H21DRAFT_733074 [Amylocystis lapponica]|nr:hypothetical protein B0H21DRAFT_733074 [Amylocystis lapponica]
MTGTPEKGGESRKRPRVDSQSIAKSEQETFHRHQDYWFEDGNVIIASRDTGFRVHSSVMSRNSQVFRNMFQSEPHVKLETIADCPVYWVPDSVVDLTNLLSVLYDAQRYFKPCERASFSLVASLIRLGHKYQMLDLRNAALERLKTLFPNNFDAWENLDTAWESAVMTGEDDGDEIIAVNLGRLTGEASILPTALYFCCQLKGDWIVNGITLADGTTEKLCRRRRALHQWHAKFAKFRRRSDFVDVRPGTMRGL